MSATPLRRLKAGSVGWVSILAFAFAATGPINGLCGAAPAALLHPGGAGLALALLLVGAVQALFAVAVAPLLRRVVDAGGFYAVVARGLSRRAGLAAAALALASYQALQLACYAMLGAFLSQAEQRLWGEGLPWWFNALLANAVVPFCSQRRVSFAARLLGLLALGELAFMLAFVAAVALRGGGPEGLSAAPFAPAQALAPGFGVALGFAVACFAGFETAAVYGEEARDPRRAVPRALLAAAALATACLSTSVWALLVAYGPSEAGAAAAREPAALWYAAVSRSTSAGTAAAMEALLLGSLFATVVGFQNAAARYLFALGRDGVVWPTLAQMHPVQETPYIANLAQASVSILALAAFGLVEDDPLRVLLGAASAFAALGLLGVQILVCAAAWRAARGACARALAGVAALSLSALLATVAAELPRLLDGSAFAARAAGGLLAAAALLGVLRGVAMKRAAPAAYAALARGRG